VEYIHDSLLVIKELLQQGGMFMHEHYPELCDIIFSQKDQRDAQDSAQTYLHKFMVFLSSMLKKDKDRNDAFLAIGNIANAVKSAIVPYLDEVLIYIRERLRPESDVLSRD
jgi:serine/threonine-protein kinase mTOR